MTVSCIIPAYNEAQTIGNVVRTARRVPSITEVIVVNDHSTDATAAVAKDAGARVITNTGGRGKAQAMQCGVSAAQGDTLVFLDADLVGLTPEHIQSLVDPIVNGRADMAIAIRDRGIWNTPNRVLGPWIAGERCLPRSLWESLPERYKKGFQIELALNHAAARQGLRMQPVVLHGLTIRKKEQKYGIVQGFMMRMKMLADLLIIIVRLNISKISNS